MEECNMVISTFCEMWSQEVDIKLCDKLDSLVSNLAEKYVFSNCKDYKVYNLLKQALLLRTKTDNDMSTLSPTCKYLITNVVSTFLLNKSIETLDSTTKIENSSLLDIVGISLDILLSVGEKEFCFNIVDQLISDLLAKELCVVKSCHFQAVMMIVECLFNCIISYNLALDCDKLSTKLFYYSDSFHNLLLYILLQSDSKTVSAYILFAVVPKYFDVSDRKNVLEIFWKAMIFDATKEFMKIRLDDKLHVLCGLSNYFIPEDMTDFFILKSDQFWNLVQQGIISNDPLLRKRGLYLLKRSVDSVAKFNFQVDLELFSWNYALTDKLKHLWDKMFILFDVLDEKQSHLVIPVLHATLKQIEDMKLIHTSWILVVYSRLLSHESLPVVKTGILLFFNISVTVYITSSLTSHIVDLLFLKLNNMLLFSCQKEDDTKWSIVDLSLRTWFKNILLNVTDSKRIFNDIVNAIMKIRWSTVPLFHVLYNMSLLPVAEIFDHQILLKLSEFLKEVIQTQNVFIRGAIQCVLLNIITKYSNRNIDLLTVANTLIIFKQSECLQRGLLTWSISKQWILSCLSLKAEKLVAQLLVKDSNLSLESQARVLVLLVDSGLVKTDLMFEKKLEDYFNVLIDAGSRLYASVDESDRCLKMINLIFDESRMFSCDKDLKNDSLVRSILPYVKEIFQYVWKMFHLVDSLEHFSNIELYLRSLYNLSENGLIYISEAELELYFEVEKILTCQDSLSIQRFFALKLVLWFIQTIRSESGNYGLGNYFKSLCLTIINRGHLLEILPKDKPKFSEDVTRNHKILWGRLTSDYDSTMWWILQKCIEKGLISAATIISSVPIQNLILMATSSIESGGRDSLKPILSVVNHLLSKTAEHSELHKNLDSYERFVEFSWKSCFELRKVSSFWPVFKSWIEMSFNTYLISEKELLPTLLKFSEEILSQGEVVNGLANVLLTHLKHELKNPKMTLQLVEPLILSIMFGPVLRREQRIENETSDQIRSLGSDYAVNSLIPKDCTRSSEEVRLTALSIVLSMAEQKEGETLVIKVIKLLLTKDGELTSRRQRYYGDSLHHRLKHRILQAVLVLEAVLEKSSSVEAQACVTELIKWSSCALQGESQQPSVRYQLEWLLLRSLLHSPNHLNNFWTIFSQASDERTGSVCSFISVAYHLAATLRDSDFIDRCVREILPWCMAQHFNLRLYAQVVMQKLWPLDPHVASKYEAICSSLTKSLNQGNAVRNAEKLKNDFYFTDFHPLNHFSFETIFWELPRLSNISRDEWIPLSTLEQCCVGLDSWVPLTNQDDKLKLFSPATWVVKATAEPEVSLEASSMQKKFVPWKSMFPELETTKTSSRTELIMVASLIDKLPNLGGLARSCEVFTAECLVVPSLEYTQDKIFSTLSMSAEKHINIVEVKPHNLPEYLGEKKKSGYTIVGAEQTAASVSLETFKFPKRCLLLLGNEKEGIPVNLLPLLDMCVEVRQLGVVRSLNVHVTGALFLWEYTRQYLDCNKE